MNEENDSVCAKSTLQEMMNKVVNLCVLSSDVSHSQNRISDQNQQDSDQETKHQNIYTLHQTQSNVAISDGTCKIQGEGKNQDDERVAGNQIVSSISTKFFTPPKTADQPTTQPCKVDQRSQQLQVEQQISQADGVGAQDIGGIDVRQEYSGSESRSFQVTTASTDWPVKYCNFTLLQDSSSVFQSAEEQFEENEQVRDQHEFCEIEPETRVHLQYPLSNETLHAEAKETEVDLQSRGVQIDPQVDTDLPHSQNISSDETIRSSELLINNSSQRPLQNVRNEENVHNIQNADNVVAGVGNTALDERGLDNQVDVTGTENVPCQKQVDVAIVGSLKHTVHLEEFKTPNADNVDNVPNVGNVGNFVNNNLTNDNQYVQEMDVDIDEGQENTNQQQDENQKLGKCVGGEDAGNAENEFVGNAQNAGNVGMEIENEFQDDICVQETHDELQLYMTQSQQDTDVVQNKTVLSQKQNTNILEQFCVDKIQTPIEKQLKYNLNEQKQIEINQESQNIRDKCMESKFENSKKIQEGSLLLQSQQNAVELQFIQDTTQNAQDAQNVVKNTQGDNDSVRNQNISPDENAHNVHNVATIKLFSEINEKRSCQQQSQNQKQQQQQYSTQYSQDIDNEISLLKQQFSAEYVQNATNVEQNNNPENSQLQKHISLLQKSYSQNFEFNTPDLFKQSDKINFSTQQYQGASNQLSQIDTINPILSLQDPQQEVVDYQISPGTQNQNIDDFKKIQTDKNSQIADLTNNFYTQQQSSQFFRNAQNAQNVNLKNATQGILDEDEQQLFMEQIESQYQQQQQQSQQLENSNNYNNPQVSFNYPEQNEEMDIDQENELICDDQKSLQRLQSYQSNDIEGQLSLTQQHQQLQQELRQCGSLNIRFDPRNSTDLENVKLVDQIDIQIKQQLQKPTTVTNISTQNIIVQEEDQFGCWQEKNFEFKEQKSIGTKNEDIIDEIGTNVARESTELAVDDENDMDSDENDVQADTVNDDDNTGNIQWLQNVVVEEGKGSGEEVGGSDEQLHGSAVIQEQEAGGSQDGADQSDDNETELYGSREEAAEMDDYQEDTQRHNITAVTGCQGSEQEIDVDDDLQQRDGTQLKKQVRSWKEAIEYNDNSDHGPGYSHKRDKIIAERYYGSEEEGGESEDKNDDDTNDWFSQKDQMLLDEDYLYSNNNNNNNVNNNVTVDNSNKVDAKDQQQNQVVSFFAGVKSWDVKTQIVKEVGSRDVKMTQFVEEAMEKRKKLDLIQKQKELELMRIQAEEEERKEQEKMDKENQSIMGNKSDDVANIKKVCGKPQQIKQKQQVDEVQLQKQKQVFSQRINSLQAEGINNQAQFEEDATDDAGNNSLQLQQGLQEFGFAQIVAPICLSLGSNDAVSSLMLAAQRSLPPYQLAAPPPQLLSSQDQLIKDQQTNGEFDAPVFYGYSSDGEDPVILQQDDDLIMKQMVQARDQLQAELKRKRQQTQEDDFVVQNLNSNSPKTLEKQNIQQQQPSSDQKDVSQNLVQESESSDKLQSEGGELILGYNKRIKLERLNQVINQKQIQNCQSDVNNDDKLDRHFVEGQIVEQQNQFQVKSSSLKNVNNLSKKSLQLVRQMKVAKKISKTEKNKLIQTLSKTEKNKLIQTLKHKKQLMKEKLACSKQTQTDLQQKNKDCEENQNVEILNKESENKQVKSFEKYKQFLSTVYNSNQTSSSQNNSVKNNISKVTKNDNNKNNIIKSNNLQNIGTSVNSSNFKDKSIDDVAKTNITSKKNNKANKQNVQNVENVQDVVTNNCSNLNVQNDIKIEDISDFINQISMNSPKQLKKFSNCDRKISWVKLGKRWMISSNLKTRTKRSQSISKKLVRTNKTLENDVSEQDKNMVAQKFVQDQQLINNKQIDSKSQIDKVQDFFKTEQNSNIFNSCYQFTCDTLDQQKSKNAKKFGQNLQYKDKISSKQQKTDQFENIRKYEQKFLRPKQKGGYEGGLCDQSYNQSWCDFQVQQLGEKLEVYNKRKQQYFVLGSNQSWLKVGRRWMGPFL